MRRSHINYRRNGHLLLYFVHLSTKHPSWQLWRFCRCCPVLTVSYDPISANQCLIPLFRLPMLCPTRVYAPLRRAEISANTMQVPVFRCRIVTRNSQQPLGLRSVDRWEKTGSDSIRLAFPLLSPSLEQLQPPDPRQIPPSKKQLNIDRKQQRLLPTYHNVSF